MELSAQSNDSNPIENLWGDVKLGVAIAKPIKDTELQDFQKFEEIIANESCRWLVEAMTLRCKAVIRNRCDIITN